jgi:hypothetical protein
MQNDWNSTSKKDLASRPAHGMQAGLCGAIARRTSHVALSPIALSHIEEFFLPLRPQFSNHFLSSQPQKKV